ncbi:MULTISPECIES: protein TolR [Thalassolituus]|jgi:biopolymer transport protein TolR|uniref:Tol-Pal system protein TolR n=1 Tax=Thalassolituus hydrocarboniclasticus TaxID=2742796 RepID=A0ABY6ACK3_9GAMM|nr:MULTISPECIES: protein TolR [Thalassolituus]MBU2039297.1 protein TolR [Gammaproteobacteria bacterium]PIQ41119.1 MAG: protein TolR [Thalassolituus sp. CG17_big_fil_post_rev_8_21_14_2_50_53_8]MCA6058257.1 protein TolR [Thalassolituus sp. ST750PaO-4]MCB2386655.1 protein TolR [Thalassolituus alkanivorans]MCB2424167.1 protein TolR [Thalassolituus alkanivorans]|tara:strand:+ start:397 stop:846 length:450 start_codon:yes stop_codon:yes gene_type:complete
MEPMAPPAAKRRPMAEINVVPYIDVMLVLLIIFMVTAPMLVQSVPVNLPDVDATPTEIEPDDSTIIVSVNERGIYFIERDEGQPTAMTLGEIQEYAQKIIGAVPETRLMIRGDEAVPYGKVVALMGGLQSVGINNVGLITEAPDPEARR